jgi:hypothetical protein
MMTTLDASPADQVSLSEARKRLAEPRPEDSAFRMVFAAALLAASACCLAMAVILGPFWQINNPQVAPLAAVPARHPASAVAAPATPEARALVAPPPPRRGHA